ncbi:MAG: hypothetical protein QE271_08040 [Bacteriovoracaceae bacterium]|nr:hypothetical protein [Bacteriovoracaceae bacterium]
MDINENGVGKNFTSREGVDCRKCIHFYVTWKQARPYGCKLFGFESQSMPSLVVKKESKQSCQEFRLKNAPKDSD